MPQKFIIKCVRSFITKCDTLIKKCDSYYKMRQFYYKMRRLLQIALFNLFNGVGGWWGGGRAIPILWKNCNPFALFPFIN